MVSGHGRSAGIGPTSLTIISQSGRLISDAINCLLTPIRAAEFFAYQSMITHRLDYWSLWGHGSGCRPGISHIIVVGEERFHVSFHLKRRTTECHIVMRSGSAKGGMRIESAAGCGGWCRMGSGAGLAAYPRPVCWNMIFEFNIAHLGNRSDPRETSSWIFLHVSSARSTKELSGASSRLDELCSGRWREYF